MKYFGFVGIVMCRKRYLCATSPLFVPESQGATGRYESTSCGFTQARSNVSDSDVEAWIPDCHEYQCDYQCDLNLFRSMGL